MSVFTTAKQEVWRQFSEAVSGKFIEERLTGNISVEVVHEPWHIILDTSEAGRHEEGYYSTLLRAPIVNPDGFRFKVHKEGFMSRIGKVVGANDLDTGEQAFDKAFILKCAQKEKGLVVFQNKEIQNLMMKLKNIHFEIKDSEGAFGPKFSADEDELVLEMNGIITNVAMLEDLLHLFSITLDTLVENGYILAKPPKTHI
jgi:hypothetical protein